MDLDARHPVWLRQHKRWIMEQDFLRSGLEVLSPQSYKEEMSFAVQKSSTDANDLEMGAADNNFEWVTNQENSYIFTHEREKYQHWKTRQARASHFPIQKSILEIYQQGVCRAQPLRNGLMSITEQHPRWQNILNDASGDGTPFDVLRNETALIGASTGLCYTMVEYEPPDSEPVSEAHRLALPNRTFLHLINPVSVLNWSMDNRGLFRWVVMSEGASDESLPGEPIRFVEQVRVATRDKYIIYRREVDENGKKEWIHHQTIEHNKGFVPVAVFRNNIRTDSNGFKVSDPFIPSLVDTDRSIYNKFSLLDQIDNNQTFSILAIPRSGAITGVNLSVFEAIGFDGTVGTPQFISPDAAIASGLWTRIKEQIQSVRMLAGVSRGLGEYSKESRSGSAITLESDEKYTKMVSFAQSIERWENQVFAMVSNMEGLPPLVSEYQKKFDVMALENKIDSMLKLVEAGVDTKSTAIIAKTAVRELLKRSGASDDEVRDATENLQMQGMQQDIQEDKPNKELQSVRVE